MQKLFVCQDAVQFVLYEQFDAQFVPKVLEFIAGLGGELPCGLVRAFKIAFSINVPIFSSAGMHT